MSEAPNLEFSPISETDLEGIQEGHVKEVKEAGDVTTFDVELSDGSHVDVDVRDMDFHTTLQPKTLVDSPKTIYFLKKGVRGVLYVDDPRSSKMRQGGSRE